MHLQMIESIDNNFNLLYSSCFLSDAFWYAHEGNQVYIWRYLTSKLKQKYVL